MDDATWQYIRSELQSYVWDRLPDTDPSRTQCGTPKSTFAQCLDVPLNPREELLARLATAYRESRLTVVLGSGISLEHGLPAWNELILQVLAAALHYGDAPTTSNHKFCALYTSLFLNDSLVAARQIETLLGRISENSDFYSTVREVLYKHEAFDANSQFYESLSNLCASSRTASAVSSIITYNFDDLLERFLDKLKIKIPYETINSPNLAKTSSASLPIYHVHGYLPRVGDVSDQPVVLSEKNYHELYSNLLHWSNIVQLRAFSEDTCVFIGLSMQDPNIRRLLDASAQLGKRHPDHRHVVVFRTPSGDGIQRKIDGLKAIDPAFAKHDYNHDQIRDLCNFNKMARSLEMQTLGCDILFIDDFIDTKFIIDSIAQGGADAN